MKPLTFSKKSWHYRAVSFAFNEWDISDNLCKYVWQVWWSCVALAVIAAVTLFVAVTAFSPVYFLGTWVVNNVTFTQHLETLASASLMNNFFMISTLAIVVTVCVFSFFIGLWFCIAAIDRRIRTGNRSGRPASLTHQYLRSLREKTCARVQFED